MTASPEIYAILCSCKGTQAESAYAESAQESTLRGLRREVRFIMSPPGKRRHNELNAAPPPETPRRTGKTGETNNRDVVHSGESFRIRGKRRLFACRAARPDLAFPSEGKVPGSSACGTTGHIPLKGKAIIIVSSFPTFF